MQIWVKTTNDSDKLYKFLSLGLSANVGSPFLSPDSKIDLDKLSSSFPHINLWDISMSTKDLENNFSALEMLATKHAYNRRLGFAIALSPEKLDYHLIKEIRDITDNQVVLDIKRANSLDMFNFIHLLNLDLNHIIFSDEDFFNYEKFFKYRNHYMKKTRLGINLSYLPVSCINDSISQNLPDFITVDLERLKL